MKENYENTNQSSKPSIDELLDSEAQQIVMRTVKALPEDVPSMAWRGDLNERLIATAARTRARRRIWWVISPSFGLAAAAVICFTVFMPHRAPIGPSVPAPAVSLED